LIVDSVTIVLGLNLGCMLLFCGKELSQNTVLYIILTIY